MKLTIDSALQKGVEAHKVGKLQEAEKFYAAILEACPSHADANHNMGVLAVSVGKLDQSIFFFEKALESNPHITQFWFSYLTALINLERIEEAKLGVRRAEEMGIEGKIFEKIKRDLSIKERPDRQLQRVPKDPTKKQLQLLLNFHSQRKFQEALKEIKRLQKQFPASPILYNIHGVTIAGFGDYQQAINSYRQAIMLKPDFAEVYNNMGISFKFQGKLQMAIESYQKAINVKADFAEAYYNMGVDLKSLGDLPKSKKAYSEAIKIKPDYAQAYNNLGNIFSAEEEFALALKHFKKALKIKPNYFEAYNNLANTLNVLGDIDGAIKNYKKALTINEKYASAHRNLSALKTYKKGDAELSQMLTLIDEKNLSAEDLCHICFALGKASTDLEEFREAFNFYKRGNKLRKEMLNYNIYDDLKMFNEIKNYSFSLKQTNLHLKKNSTDLVPIFIVGMPRSGTTLVEQIISAHSKVKGGEELFHLREFGGTIATGASQASAENLLNFRKKYLQKLKVLSQGAHFVTDKMPQNFRYICLIRTALPEAKIIHVIRNAAATCWSNYKQYFSVNGLGYSYDLEDLVKYYRMYKELMDFWNLQYSDMIYTVNYDKLTIDQEEETKNLIKFLGLAWQDKCLYPHKNKRSVKTASNLQVRKKVYRGSSNDWRKFEPFLNGIFDNLE